MQQNTLKCEANSAATRILTRENGGGGLNQSVRMVWDRGRRLRRSKIEWYDIWTLLKQWLFLHDFFHMVNSALKKSIYCHFCIKIISIKMEPESFPRFLLPASKHKLCDMWESIMALKYQILHCGWRMTIQNCNLPFLYNDFLNQPMALFTLWKPYSKSSVIL